MAIAGVAATSVVAERVPEPVRETLTLDALFATEKTVPLFEDVNELLPTRLMVNVFSPPSDPSVRGVAVALLGTLAVIPLRVITEPVAPD